MKPLPGDNKSRGFKTLRGVYLYTGRMLFWLLAFSACLLIGGAIW